MRVASAPLGEDQGVSAFIFVTAHASFLQLTHIQSIYAHCQVFRMPCGALCYTPFDTQPILCGMSMLLI